LKGRVAIVTGAGRGIGRAEALALAEEGAAVVVNDFGGSAAGEGGEQSPADEVVETIKKNGGQAVANYGSVSDFKVGDELVKQALDNFGRLDIVVNNAGILRDRMIFNMSEEEWDMVIAVHLKGHFNVCRHASVVFRQQRSGVIVNTASEAGLGLTPGQPNYAAAKEGIVGLTRSLARDLGRYNVRANAIRPQAGTRLTQTMVDAARERGNEQMARMYEQFMEQNPPEAIAPLVAWLCTDEASNVNGRTFLVSGRRIGLYSEPEIIADIQTDHVLSIDEVSKLVPEKITGNLTNPFAPKEQPAG
jgi:NAD(P)-dependent dehydrogenase (short-subunit alcohol dehydrogenase family)